MAVLGGLNCGNIRWKFFDDLRNSDEAKKLARDWLIRRGFVRLFEADHLPRNIKTYYVARRENKFSVPFIDEKLALFTSSSYACGYAAYLNGRHPGTPDLYLGDEFRYTDSIENVVRWELDYSGI